MEIKHEQSEGTTVACGILSLASANMQIHLLHVNACDNQLLAELGWRSSVRGESVASSERVRMAVAVVVVVGHKSYIKWHISQYVKPAFTFLSPYASTMGQPTFVFTGLAHAHLDGLVENVSLWPLYSYVCAYTIDCDSEILINCGICNNAD